MRYKIGQPIICSTSFSGIFFGFVKEYIQVPGVGASITLSKGRQVLFWSQDMRGYLGLAVMGPSQECVIGTVAEEITLHSCTSDMPVQETAYKSWGING